MGMGITRMDTIIRTAIPITDRIGIIATTGLIIGAAGIAITATTVIITVIIGNQMT